MCSLCRLAVVLLAVVYCSRHNLFNQIGSHLNICIGVRKKAEQIKLKINMHIFTINIFQSCSCNTESKIYQLNVLQNKVFT